jgi:hypothetical protein
MAVGVGSGAPKNASTSSSAMSDPETSSIAPPARAAAEQLADGQDGRDKPDEGDSDRARGHWVSPQRSTPFLLIA